MDIDKQKIIENALKRSEKYNKKIDKLAKEYFTEVLQISEDKKIFKNEGYYTILYYCLTKIQRDDENSFLGYVAIEDTKKER